MAERRGTLRRVTLMNRSLWDRAGLIGASYGEPADESPLPGLPSLALLFARPNDGALIFYEWLQRLSRIDADGALRFLLVEGPIDGEPPGFTLSISAEGERIFSRQPWVGDPGALDTFKANYIAAGAVLVTPGLTDDRGRTMTSWNYGIVATRFEWRHSSDIAADDRDACILQGAALRARKVS
jgi:hypothetical protein